MKDVPWSQLLWRCELLWQLKMMEDKVVFGFGRGSWWKVLLWSINARFEWKNRLGL